MKKRTPQEKKRLSYEKDRRNVYGESPHASRTAIPRHKAFRNRANRHLQDQQLRLVGPDTDEELADNGEARLHHHAPKVWEKVPDQPLGSVLERRREGSRRMHTSGNRREVARKARATSTKRKSTDK